MKTVDRDEAEQICEELGIKWDSKTGRPYIQPRKRKKTSDLVLLVLALFLLGFIVTMTVIFCIKDAVPDTLIQYTLGAGGVEALLLAGIRISKVLKGENTDEN